MIRALRERLRKQIAARPGSLLQVQAQAALGYLHDPDFGLFSALAELPGLVLDVGAHRGQSAISILSRTRHLKVLSFEPNPACRMSLLLLAARHPGRFRFRLHGAGATSATAELWVPGSSGSGLSSEASLKPAEFERTVVRERLATRGVDSLDPQQFRRQQVRLMALDELQLKPDFIKLDVEGSEAEALQGLSGTLERCRPALLVELNDGARWLPELDRLGYRYYRYRNDIYALEALDPPAGVVNLVALCADNPAPVTGALLKLRA